MTNFEKFKQDLTVERLTDMLADTLCMTNDYCCDYCSYDRYGCLCDCEYGVKKYLESEAE